MIGVEEAARRIGMPVSEWPGRCHEIAALCLVAGVTTGTLRYGLWHGPIDGQKVRAPFHHGWVEVEAEPDPICTPCECCPHVEDEHKKCGLLRPCTIRGCGCEDYVVSHPGPLVFDPTRFVFEGKRPYVFLGNDDMGYYDVAGDRQREQLAALPCPVSATKGKLVTIKLGVSARLTLLEILHSDQVARQHARIVKSGIRLPTLLAGWLANRPLSALGPFAEELYKALDAVGLDATVPLDCREVVMGDGFYGKKEAYERRIARVREFDAKSRRQASA
jgi:hypothetical protein